MRKDIEVLCVIYFFSMCRTYYFCPVRSFLLPCQVGAPRASRHFHYVMMHESSAGIVRRGLDPSHKINPISAFALNHRDTLLNAVLLFMSMNSFMTYKKLCFEHGEVTCLDCTRFLNMFGQESMHLF